MFKAEMNLTYNFYKSFKKVFKNGIEDLNNKKARNCIGILQKAVKKLGCKSANNPWKNTDENAGFYLQELLNWVVEYLEGIFKIYN